VNPKIVGGARIEFQGKWRDFSLEKEIEKLYGRI
jgi:F0F1-type ATP synthase delta subunit